MTGWRRWVAAGGALAAVTSVAGCGAGVRGETSETAALPAPVGNTQLVAQSNLGHLWPFTIAHGTISCEVGGKAIFTTSTATIYGLNNIATSSGLPSPDPIRKEGAAGTPVSLGAMTSLALKLCK
jgi:hypothetical protein